MEGWQIALIVKPFVLLAFFFVIRCATETLRHRMPDGALKRLLYFSWRI